MRNDDLIRMVRTSAIEEGDVCEVIETGKVVFVDVDSLSWVSAINLNDPEEEVKSFLKEDLSLLPIVGRFKNESNPGWSATVSADRYHGTCCLYAVLNEHTPLVVASLQASPDWRAGELAYQLGQQSWLGSQGLRELSCKLLAEHVPGVWEEWEEEEE